MKMQPYVEYSDLMQLELLTNMDIQLTLMTAW